MDTPRPILEHLTELRRRIIVSVLVLAVAAAAAFAFYEPIALVLYRPFLQIGSSVEGASLFMGSILEGFLTRLRVAVLSGLIVSLPIHTLNLIGFVFPGLTRRERWVVAAVLAVSLVLIVASAWYGYFVIVPISISFLMSSGFVPEGVGVLLGYRANITYLFQFLLGTLVIFQVPIVLEVLMIFGLVTRKALLGAGRYVVVGAFVLSAVLTPPDFISQLSLAIPLVALYFLSIAVARLFGFGRS